MDIKEKILVALGLNKDEETVTLGWQAKSEDGTIFVSTAEELESGVDVSVLTEDGTTIPLPVGTYKTDTGVSFRVEEDGVVGEVIESETEEKDTPKEEEMTKEKEDEEDEEELKKKDEYEEEADVQDWEGMEKRIKNLEDAIADIKKEIGESGDVEEMSEENVEPSTNPKTIKTTEVKEFSAEDEIKKLKEENESLKTELSTSPSDAPININKFSSERKALSRKEYNKLSKQERFIYNLGK